MQLSSAFLPRSVNPRVITNLCDGCATIRIDFETKKEKVECVGRPGALRFADSSLDGGGWVREGTLTAEKDAEKHAERPDLGVRCTVRLALQDLGAGKSHGAEKTVEERLRLSNICDDGGAEIDELDVEISVDHTVLVLDISVADADAVKMPDGLDDLSKYPASLFFRETRVLLDALEQVAAGTALHSCRPELLGRHHRLGCSRLPRSAVELHDEIEEVAVVEQIDELDDTRVIHNLEHERLHRDDAELGVAHPAVGRHLVLEDELDSDRKTVGVALGCDDKSEAAAAELIAKRV